MTWLDRLKNHHAPHGDAAKPAKPGSVASVAPGPGLLQISSSSIVPPRLRALAPANVEVLPCVVDRTCADCLNLLRRGTCGEPVDAGLVHSFSIIWPPEGHAAGCAAFRTKPPALNHAHPYRLTPEQGDRCHAPCWDDAEIDRFQKRHARFVRQGIADTDADDLAERLTLRDRASDDRRLCLECRELALSGRCSAAARGDMPGVGRHLEPVPDILMNCQHFKPAVSAHGTRQGPKDASHDT